MSSATVKRLSGNHDADRASWAAVRDLCCRTGDNGDPIAPERWELFSRIWIEPYEKLLPEWTYVAESGGLLVGYLTGCPDSQKFLRQKTWRATFPLLMAIACGRYRHNPGAAAFARQALGIRRSAERCFTPSLRRELVDAYPAHLHINIDARYRRMGLGRGLMDSYFTELKRHAVSGVHLYCGAGPVPFYLRLGFQVLESIEIRGNVTFAMGTHL
jgi:GNAT superfamily N-acetyltransferase